MRIKIGHGTNGDIFEDLEKVKACNFCKYFKGYGLHAVNGHCSKFNKDIDGGYIGNYSTTAKRCIQFEVKEELIEKPLEESSSKLSEEIDDVCKDCIYDGTDCPGGMWCFN